MKITKIKQSRKDNTISKKRILCLAVFFTLGFGLVVYRMYFLQIKKHQDYALAASDQHNYFSKVEPDRGEIKVFDKGSPAGDIVATSIKVPLVYVIPKDIRQIDSESVSLARILNMDAQIIAQKMTDKSRMYVPIKKNLSKEEEKAVQALELPGIHLDYEKQRYYPENTLLAQVLGYVGYRDTDRVGLYGLEKVYEEELRGRPGVANLTRGLAGNWIFGTDEKSIPAKNGDTLILTIDRATQYKVESILKDAVEKNEADSGSAIVMDPKTGAIISMATYPTFDPNKYGEAKDLSVFNNQATQGVYEPGSVFKAFTVAAGLNEGKITPESTYVDTGKVEVDNYVIENSDKKAHGKQTMTQVLEESLNTGVIYIKEKIGDQKFLEYVKAFGFGSTTGVELPEAKGNISNLTGKVKVNFDTASFGQGLSVTPIQLVRAYAVIANKGVMMEPYIIKSQIDGEGNIVDQKQKKSSEVITATAAELLTKMLVSVVEKGHGKKASVPGYWVAGKTGTAQVPKEDGKGYDEDNNIGSFVGYFPAYDPKFVVLVRVNHPRTVKFAESTAAPAFGEIAKFLLEYYNIPPDREIKK